MMDHRSAERAPHPPPEHVEGRHLLPARGEKNAFIGGSANRHRFQTIDAIAAIGLRRACGEKVPAGG
jgi:hypothetical protein